MKPVIIGRTNLVEFAYSGLGLNPHYGTAKNAFDPRDRAHPWRLVVRCSGISYRRHGSRCNRYRYRRVDPHPVRAKRVKGGVTTLGGFRDQLYVRAPHRSQQLADLIFPALY
jgi:Asp-tRNA(Asn)/Glu-tRNA(Gln) amidotransferase A subunit family amidase